MGRVQDHRTGGTCRLPLSRYCANTGRMCRNGGMLRMSQETPAAYSNQPLSAAGSPVNRSALPGSDEARQITVISGLKCLGLSTSSGPLGCLERTLLTSQGWNSTLRYLTWKVRDIVCGHFLFQLVPSMHGTGGIGVSLLPTPDTMPEAPNKNCNRKYPKNLLQAAQDGYTPMLPTPSALNGHNCGTFQEWGGAWNKLRGSTLASGKVNPVWEEWLMGFPADWTTLDDSNVVTLLAMPSSRSRSTRSSKQSQTSKGGCK